MVDTEIAKNNPKHKRHGKVFTKKNKVVLPDKVPDKFIKSKKALEGAKKRVVLILADYDNDESEVEGNTDDLVFLLNGIGRIFFETSRNMFEDDLRQLARFVQETCTDPMFWYHGLEDSTDPAALSSQDDFMWLLSDEARCVVERVKETVDAGVCFGLDDETVGLTRSVECIDSSGDDDLTELDIIYDVHDVRGFFRVHINGEDPEE